MSNLFFALLFLSVGTFFLVRRDRVVALNLEAYRRWPSLRRIPIVGWGHDSEWFQRRLIMFDAVFILAMATVFLISWVVSR
jgi:hypothetical protein